MTTDSDWEGINQVTTDFDLEVGFTGDKLKIRLKDFKDWVIYEKIYTVEDIGLKEIHKKADLSDIFHALVPSREDTCSIMKIPSWNDCNIF